MSNVFFSVVRQGTIITASEDAEKVKWRVTTLKENDYL